MKLAIVGCNGFGRVHLDAIKDIRKEMKDLEIYVFNRKEEVAKECMKEYEANGYFTSYNDVLKSNVEIVDLIVSHDAHEPMGTMAMKSGKHVMLEKPIARNEQEAESLINTAIQTKVKFMVLENFYFDPTVWKAKEIMPKLGKISLIIVRNTISNFIKGWRTNKQMMGGGALIDGGIHFVDTMLNLGGEYTEVKGMCKRTFAGLEGEDTSVAIFNFKGGYIGTLIYSWATKGEKYPRFEIYGEKGSIKEDYATAASRKPYGNLIIDIDGVKDTVNIEPVNTVKEEIKAFLNSVINDKEVPMNPRLALRDLKAVLDVYRQCGEI